MQNESLMQKALGEQWQQLPPVLQTHYQYETNSDIGNLNIEYPSYMQLYLTFLHMLGALINRRGKEIPTIVEKQMRGDRQYWNRTIHFPNNRNIYFKSVWVYNRGNELIEYVNRFLGLRMRVHVEDNKLHYEGLHFVLKIGKRLIPIPEWLFLGHTTIVESQKTNSEFEMNFIMKHPLLGVVFGYTGTFKIISDLIKK